VEQQNADGQSMLASTLIPQPFLVTHAPFEEDVNIDATQVHTWISACSLPRTLCYRIASLMDILRERATSASKIDQQDLSWNMAIVLDDCLWNGYLVKLVGSLEELEVTKLELRVQLSYQNDEWVDADCAKQQKCYGSVRKRGKASDSDSAGNINGKEIYHGDTDQSDTDKAWADEIHRQELSAYRSTLDAFYASGPLTWEKETM
nr:EMSY domain-containing protein, agenet domain [Tanacetum cinerariifolium]